MLTDKTAMANIAVKSLARARSFYEGTLGLKETEREGDHLIAYRSGVSTILVALKAKDVTFEHYDLPGMTRKGDLHVAGDMKAGWFKDPDGNILSIVSG